MGILNSDFKIFSLSPWSHFSDVVHNCSYKNYITCFQFSSSKFLLYIDCTNISITNNFYGQLLNSVTSLLSSNVGFFSHVVVGVFEVLTVEWKLFHLTANVKNIGLTVSTESAWIYDFGCTVSTEKVYRFRKYRLRIRITFKE